ncbi:MAG: aminotransferase class III-fold pyridoxal phosphate-dependent enzyme [Flavobacteriaceae bacterium]
MGVDYLAIQIKTDQAEKIVEDLYQLKGTATVLPGEVDFNFRIKTASDSYILKISRPDEEVSYIEFQQELLNYVVNSEDEIGAPKTFSDRDGKFISEIIDAAGNVRKVRLLSWIDGRLWSSVNPIKDNLLFSLGEEAGKLTNALQGFDHPKAHREFVWDVAQAEWTYEYAHLFSEKHQKIASYFQNQFKSFQKEYKQLRKGVVHNDANDNNIIVTNDLINPQVKAIIDYGDAVSTPIINDLAVATAYAIMHKPDALAAALPIVKGYHAQFALAEEELKFLYNLIAMRLIISVTKSAINKQKEPDNAYLLISEKPAWNVLEKWIDVDENLAHYSFREACGYTPHPNENMFTTWAAQQIFKLHSFFPTLNFNEVFSLDLGVSSTWLGQASEYNDIDYSTYKINSLQKERPNSLLVGAYNEARPFYNTAAYQKEGNSGPQYRTIHLGSDFFVPVETPIHSFYGGKVISLHNIASNKDYGNVLILEHQTDNGISFYTLYGHLSNRSLAILNVGDTVKKGDLIAYIGNVEENGNWVPHLHFQVILALLGIENDFPGVAYPNQKEVFKSICPNPNVLFKAKETNQNHESTIQEILSYRNAHLGKSLSVSYDEPLKIVRGEGVYLIDNTGRKYLDTVNNVAHVGHEHPRVVKAGQQQMGILNTNTRYLNENINEFAKELLSTFPENLSVVYFVNSGSEAMELAMRMIKVNTGQKDMIAVEIGYHGNANACIDISSYKFDGKGGSGSSEYTHIVPLPDTYRGLYVGENTGADYAKHIQEQIDTIQTKGRNVAGFICEPIVSCGGQVELPKEYLKIAYQAVRDAGGLCLSDEVQVGCGRVGSHFWGFELHDVIPDIVTIGKPIGNGHPLAAVVCTQEVASGFANGMEYFNTFGGNPVSSAIGREVLRVIKDENLQENALTTGNYLKDGLRKLQQDFPIIGDIRGQGLFLGIELVDENKKPLTKKAAYLTNRMKDFAILMSTDGKDNNVLKVKPPIVFSQENADELLSRLQTIFKEDYMTYICD